ncbi:MULTISPECIES: hypothetical protein [Synechococcales]|uniref:hypothetical protein n=1 Tax=Synechococcus sp. CS-1324 TaxID=2847980 RepID=UPI00223B1387|nr:hypothetical protein [Synechococcus sp. CS-1324]
MLLITDSSLFSRSGLAFQQHGLQVVLIAADPALLPSQQNFLVLREAAITLPYQL